MNNEGGVESAGSAEAAVELEQQRRKLETLGRLAGNVVHDFNNLLMVIEGYTRMLLEEPHLSESAQESAQEILSAAERAGALTRQLLAFSRRKSIERKPIDVNAQLKQMRTLLTRLLGETVRLEFELAPGHCLILASSSQLEQVLLNLIVNARDAMPIGGRILVRTRLDETGAYIEVEDTGVGIPEEVIPRIFEPFFTTKEQGKGTGIGLALVDETVREWGGRIEVSSRLREGTRFIISLPQVQPELREPEGQPPGKPVPVPKLGKILLVEDEAGVRSLIRRILEQRHYEVFEAPTEDEALDLARGESKIDVLVTDLELARGDGRRLAGLVRVLHPAIKIVYISGYMTEFRQNNDEMSLQKPFSPNTLVLAVQQLLKLP